MSSCENTHTIVPTIGNSVAQKTKHTFCAQTISRLLSWSYLQSLTETNTQETANSTFLLPFKPFAKSGRRDIFLVERLPWIHHLSSAFIKRRDQEQRHESSLVLRPRYSNYQALRGVATPRREEEGGDEEPTSVSTEHEVELHSEMVQTREEKRCQRHVDKRRGEIVPRE